MKSALLVSAAFAAAMFAPSAFAQEQTAPKPPQTSAGAQALPIQGTPEAAAAVRADEARSSVQTVAAANNGEPVAAEVAAVVQSGKRYTTDDLVRAQAVAMNIANQPVSAGNAAPTNVNATRTPGPNTNVFATQPSPTLRAEARNIPTPAQPQTSATAENTVVPNPNTPSVPHLPSDTPGVQTPDGVVNPGDRPTAPTTVPPEQ
jgi:hypothetical protein